MSFSFIECPYCPEYVRNQEMLEKHFVYCRMEKTENPRIEDCIIRMNKMNDKIEMFEKRFEELEIDNIKLSEQCEKIQLIKAIVNDGNKIVLQ